MRAGEARAIARTWVESEVRSLPGFLGAYFAGSTRSLPAEVPLDPASDVDIVVVLAGEPAIGVPAGKIAHGGVLLDITPLARERIATPERVLADYHLAGGFRTPGIILDPTGALATLQTTVVRDFARQDWVIRRRDQASARVTGLVDALDAMGPSAPFHEQVVLWLFGTGVLTHVLLVAGLRNPTVRTRYVAVRDLLRDHGALPFYEALLGSLGCAGMGRDRVTHHLDRVTAAFDAAREITRTPVPFASDISLAARPVAIDGSRALIGQGDHREAVFWLVVTFSRCMAVFGTDASPETFDRFDREYRAFLADLGIAGAADLRTRGAGVRRLLPDVQEVSDAIMAATPEIRDA